jgi:hypothetical protein
MAYVVGPSATAAFSTITNSTTGTTAALSGLISIAANSRSIAFADVTALSDTTLQRIPVRADPGTVQLTIFLDDTATASNLWTVLNTRRTSKVHTRITVDLPGSSIDGLLTYDGYISEISTPEVSASDEALRFTVSLQLSDKDN